jgi:hypothetical protein
MEASSSSTTTTKAAVQQQQQQQGAVALAIPVSQACEAIWGCQDAAQAIYWIQALHAGIIREQRLDSYEYDPSEAFMAVQGAALRFRTTLTTSTSTSITTASTSTSTTASDETEHLQQQQQQEKEDHRQQLATKALWAAAALAHNCVGPAWFYQVHRRRMLLRKRTDSQENVDDMSVASMLIQSMSMSTQTQTHTFSASDANHHDLHHLHHRHHHSAPLTPTRAVNSHPANHNDNDNHDNHHHRSWSNNMPMMPEVPLSLMETNCWYPPIPEVLPAAMLRFAATMVATPVTNIDTDTDTDTNSIDPESWTTARAQIILVLALTCVPEPEEGENEENNSAGWRSTPEWTIPGVQNAVETMVLSWLRLATTTWTSAPGSKQIQLAGQAQEKSVSQFILQVTRACTDIFSAGWRPRTEVCTAIVGFLLGIALEGFGVRSRGIIDIDAGDTPPPPPQAHGEDLISAAGAVEAISALASIGTHGLIPTQSLTSVVETLCRLYASEENRASESDCFPVSVDLSSWEEQEEAKAQYDILKTQRDLCLADIADFLWMLLARDSSAEATMEALLSIFDEGSLACTNCNLPDCEGSWNAEATMVCLESGVAIRIVSGALWGKPPDTLRIPSLRSYWGHVIDSVSRTLSSVHSDAGQQPQSDNRRRTKSLYALTVEMVRTISRTIDSEIHGPGGLSQLEWASVVKCMQEGITPWLSYHPSRGDDPIGACCSTALSFFISVGDFLEKCIRFENTPFAEYEDQKVLYLMLLRDVYPRLKADAATIVGSAAICCWAKFGLFPHRVEGWSQTASDILGEAFSTTDQGDCLYSPRVRLEALKALTFEENEPQGSEGSKYQGDQGPSLLTLTENMREQHLSFIDSSLIPALRTIIWCATTPLLGNLGEGVSDASLLGVREEEVHEVGSNEETVVRQIATLLSREVSLASDGAVDVLELFTVKLIGRLFRGVTGDKRHRSLFVEMLRSVALNEKDESDASCRRQLSHAFPVRVAAVVELERCLAAPFTTLSYAHASVPRIVEALCSIVDECSGIYSQQHLSSRQFYQASTLVVAALDPLTRLRVALDSHVAFRIRDRSANNIDEILFSFFSASKEPDSMNRSTLAETRGETFLVERRAYTNRMAANKTVVSFEHIVTSLIGLLATLQMDWDAVSSIASQFRTCVKVTCFDTLRSMALACIPVELTESMTSKVFFPDESVAGKVDDVEILARSRALGQIAQIAAVKAWERQAMQKDQREPDHPAKDDVFNCALALVLPWERQAMQADQRESDHQAKDDDFNCALSLVLRLVGSRTEGEFVSGCDVLCSLLSTLIRFDRNRIYCFMEQVCDTIEKRVTIELESVCRVGVQQLTSDCLFSSVTLLTVIHDLLLSDADALWQLPKQMVSASFRLCNEVIARSSEVTENFYSHLAIRCLVALVDSMDIDQVQEAKATFPHGNEWDTASNSIILSKVIAEVLERHSYMLRQKGDGNMPDQYPVSVSKLETMAMESDNIDRFEVEDDIVAQCTPSAAWLYGENVLLTCRIGASKSRYRGWIEVAIRTLSCRTRILVRLPGSVALENVSLENPEFPGCLWNTKATEATESNAESDLRYESSLASDAVADRARAVLSRFDSLVLSSDRDRPSRLQTDRRNVVDVSLDRSHHAIATDFRTESPRKHVAVPEWLRSVVKDDINAMMTIQAEIDALLSASGIDTDNAAHTSTRLKGSRKLERAISILDRISVFNTHKVAVLYDRPAGLDMDEETRVLTTTHCSPAFHNFAGRIGKIAPTRHLKFFSAGLDCSEYQSDGKYAMTWIDEDGRKSMAATSMIVFHVVSLMPEGVRTRKRHVGNDIVLILYSDKGSNDNDIVDFDLAERDLSRSVLRGEFGWITIYVTSPSPNFLRVALRVRNGLPQDLHDSLSHLVSDHILPEQDTPAYVRNLAIRADLTCRAAVDAIDPPSNCLERYRLLHEMQRYITKD